MGDNVAVLCCQRVQWSMHSLLRTGVTADKQCLRRRRSGNRSLAILLETF